MKITSIKENYLYKKVYINGNKVYGKYTIIYTLKDSKAYKFKKENPGKKYINRVGLTVTKKIGKSVIRNRVKRIIRAAFVQIEKNYYIKKGNLIVIVAREEAVESKSGDIYSEMIKQFSKLALIEEKRPENKSN